MKASHLIAITTERMEQDKKWGGPKHDDKQFPFEWIDFIRDHANRALNKSATDRQYRYQLVRVAALAVAALEASDRAIMRSTMTPDEKREALKL